ncbi:TPA: hypothetical protein ACH3X1_004169 [Trebouxia sp. C0004]
MAVCGRHTPAANDHACRHAQHDSNSDSDEYDYVGNKRYNVISGKSLRHGFEMSACNALSQNGLQMQNTFFYLNYGRHPKTPHSLNVPTENPAANDYVQNIAEASQKARACLQAAQ